MEPLINEPESISSVLHCPACSKEIKPEDLFCQNCGFPIQGSAEERQTFISNRDYRSMELNDMQKKIKNASTSIFVIGAFIAGAGVFLFLIAPNSSESNVLLLTNIIVALIFFGLGFWCKKQPVAAIICALSLYVILWVIAIVTDPVNIVKGIIVKILIVGYLIKGLNSAIEAQRLKKTYNL